MNSPEVKSFIKKHSSLFWYFKKEAKENISHEILVEFILNFGDEKAVKKLIELLGIDYVADVFYKKSKPGKRTNYLPLVINFFNLYFSRHAYRNSEQRAS